MDLLTSGKQKRRDPADGRQKGGVKGSQSSDLAVIFASRGSPFLSLAHGQTSHWHWDPLKYTKHPMRGKALGTWQSSGPSP